MEILWITIGALASILTSFGFAPQVHKMWKTKSVGDVSILTMWQTFIGVSLWLLYGIGRGDPIIIIANIICGVMFIAGIVFFYHFR